MACVPVDDLYSYLEGSQQLVTGGVLDKLSALDPAELMWVKHVLTKVIAQLPPAAQQAKLEALLAAVVGPAPLAPHLDNQP